MPLSWLKIIKKNGINVNLCLSTFFYNCLTLLLFLKNFTNIILIFTSKSKYARTEYFTNNDWLSNETVIVGGNDDLVSTTNGIQLENFSKWLAKHNFASYQSISINPGEIANFSKKTFLIRLKLILLTIHRFYIMHARTSFSTSSLINFSELLLFEKIVSSKNEIRVRKIFFNNSHSVYKPIWTKTLEDRGAKVIFVFYSVDEEPLYLSGKIPQNDFWCISEWSDHYVADEIQKKIFEVLSNKSSAVYTITGLPWWSDAPVVLNKYPKKTVSLFDVEPPVLGHYGLTTYNSYGFHKIENTINFLETIVRLCCELDIIVMHKSKRKIGSSNYIEYKKTISQLSQNYPNFYFQIEPKVAPSRLIQSTSGTISMPFTSTALIAQSIGKPSIYFYNSFIFPPNHHRLAIIKCITIKDELKNWLLANFK
jgi:polysaccharide biosynthesis PFTS motif protein